jgi:hypothetical protein
MVVVFSPFFPFLQNQSTKQTQKLENQKESSCLTKEAETTAAKAMKTKEEERKKQLEGELQRKRE